MYLLAQIMHFVVPLVAIVIFIYGVKKENPAIASISFWLSILVLIIHYEFSGGEILGVYFDYYNTTIYTINILIMTVSLIYLLSMPSIKQLGLRIVTNFVKAVLVIGCLILLTNLWINAYFIESRLTGSPVMQVATMGSSKFCSYKYVFFIVAKDGSVKILCPNQYGLIPGIKQLNIVPDFIARQLSHPLINEVLKKQKNDDGS